MRWIFRGKFEVNKRNPTKDSAHVEITPPVFCVDDTIYETFFEDFFEKLKNMGFEYKVIKEGDKIMIKVYGEHDDYYLTGQFIGEPHEGDEGCAKIVKFADEYYSVLSFLSLFREALYRTVKEIEKIQRDLENK